MSSKISDKEVQTCLHNLENTSGMPKYAPKGVRRFKIGYDNTEDKNNFTVSFSLVIAMFILGAVIGFLFAQTLMAKL